MIKRPQVPVIILLGKRMESYLEIEFVMGEPSKIRVKASNGYYSGYTEQYINSEWLSKLIKELKDFPENNDSVVFFETEQEKMEESDLFLKFYCNDNLGHTELRVCIKEGLYASTIADEAKFKLSYEAAALDRFIETLKNVISNGHGFATLVGVNKNA